MAGAECCSNPPTPIPTSGHGHVVDDLGGLKAYVVGSPDSKFAVLLISDIFGFEAPKLRELADKTAASGFFVVVPDFFHGDPYDHDNPQRPIMTWLEDHGTDKGFEDAKSVVEALKTKGISVIGAAGFCWGAKVVANLAKTDELKAAVMLHPSRVTVEDIKEIKAPLSVLGAEIDKSSPPELLKQFEEVLLARPEKLIGFQVGVQENKISRAVWYKVALNGTCGAKDLTAKKHIARLIFDIIPYPLRLLGPTSVSICPISFGFRPIKGQGKSIRSMDM